MERSSFQLLRGRRIVVVANEPWGEVFYSKHHIALELAKRNEVCFVNPFERFRPTHGGRRGRGDVTIRRVSPTLQVADGVNRLPLTGRVDRFYRRNLRSLSLEIRRLFAPDSDTILWNFDAFRELDPEALGATSVVHHAVDLYSNPRELEMASRADLLVSVSPRIAERYGEVDVPKLVVPHGVVMPEGDDLRVSAPTAVDAPVVLMATLTERIDYELLLQLADRLAPRRLDLIGPVLDRDFNEDDHRALVELDRRENVRLVGSVPYSELGPYLQAARLCLVALKQDQPSNQIGSLKVLQYFARGRPVVATPLSDCLSYERDGLLRFARSREQYVEACLDSLASPLDPSVADKRRDVARAASYRSRLMEIDRALMRLSTVRPASPKSVALEGGSR